MELKPVAPLDSTVWNSMQGVLNATAKGVRLKDKSHPGARFVLSILALALASLPAAPAWADGGMGGAASGGGSAGGAGGSYASPDGGDAIANIPGGGGGGGGVSLTTGLGGKGGKNGISIPGGNGGAVGSNGLQGAQGIDGGGTGGGGGGFGAILNSAGAAGNSLGTTLTGGAGGAGGEDVGLLGGGGGGGGAGGGGILLLSSGAYTNAGVLAGGAGGAGGSSLFSSGGGGGGGDGGVGAAMMGEGRIINSGTIAGGNGGIGGASAGAGIAGAAGAGGVGISGSDIAIVNSGTIAGGMSGDAVAVRGDAIQFTGGTNSLELWSGSTIIGNVKATSGDTLILGGAANANFDVAEIGAGNKYDGFPFFEKSGAGTWTLTNTTAEIMTWTIKQGTLAISQDGSLGDPCGCLILDGGALRATAGFTSMRDILLDTAGGTIQADFNATPLILGGSIEGDGRLTVAGPGTLMLSGINAYTGGTTLAAGTLAISGDFSLGDPDGGLVFNGGTLRALSGFTSARNIVLDAGGGTVQSDLDAAPLALTGSISGPGGLTTSGAGTLILSGVNTYAGGTAVRSDVNVAVTGALGSGPVTVDGSAPGSSPVLTFQNASSAGALGIRNHNGGVTVFADSSTAGNAQIVNEIGGASVFSDTSSAGSASIVNQAGGVTILADTSSAGTAAISNNAAGWLFFNDSATADQAAVMNNAGGVVDISSLLTGGAAIGSLSGAGNVNLGGKALTLGGLNRDAVISGVIADGGTAGGTGGSLVKTGTGMLVLNGVSTYTGGTTVTAGTLKVGDAAAPAARIAGNVQVGAAGTLRGHGTVGGDVANGGVVRPGGSIGTLTVAGNYIQDPGGTLMIDVSPTAASQLKVGGTATLGGALSILYGPGTYTAASYSILSAGAVKGAFATVTGNTPGGFVQSVVTGATGVDLNLASGVIAPINATIFGAVSSAGLRAGQQVNDDLLHRLSRPCLSPGEQACVQPDRSVWIQANGAQARIDGNHGAPDVRDQRYGFLAGADRQWKGWTVGLAAGYSHAQVKEDETAAKGVLDTLRLAGYAGRSVGPVNLAGTMGYAYDFLSTTRPFGPFGNAKGSGHGQEFNAGIQASVPWALGPVVLTPHLGMRYAHLRGLALNETGPTNQNLDVGSQTLNSLQPYVGVTLDYPFQVRGKRSGSFQARVGYAYETQSVNRKVLVAAADGTGFAVPGTTDSRGMVTTGAGVTLPIGKTADAYVRYDALLHTGNVSAQSLRVGASYRF